MWNIQHVNTQTILIFMIIISKMHTFTFLQINNKSPLTFLIIFTSFSVNYIEVLN